MDFRRFDLRQLPELMGWFPDAQALRAWGGPDFRHPFTDASFREDAKVDGIDSFSLVDADGTLTAFGQCYLRVERCHFGRVAVAPGRRGEGLGSRLFREMADWGRERFGPREQSLFVNRNNADALRLYLRLGFREVPYPVPDFMPSARYMIADRMRER